MACIHITDLESAINFWSVRAPTEPGLALASPIRALAEVYGRMVFAGQLELDESFFPSPALAAWLAWYHSTPDTPCIAICTTSQGDDWCKGCGRSFEEVQNWTQMRPAQKRQTWRRIVTQGTAWRFNRYAERNLDRVMVEPTESPGPLLGG